MAERHEDRVGQTNRPEPPLGQLTVRDVLREDAVLAGQPEILVGDDALTVPVRWVHASDSADVARLLVGGELILTTASAWPTEPEALEAFIEGLVEARTAGVVIELGTHYRYVPSIVQRTARRLGLALVALHREIKFVTVTEAVHRRVISAHTAALRSRDEVRERFTALALRGSPADFVVQQLATTLNCGIVLENLAHEVIVADGPLGDEQKLFTDWEPRSRALHRAAGQSEEVAVDDGWLIVPVEARGHRWGHIVALPGPGHRAGRYNVVQQAAVALAIGRLVDAERDEWAAIGRRRLLDGLLTGRFSGLGGVGARLSAAGMPVDGRLIGLVVSGVPVNDERADTAARALGGRALTGSAPRGVAQPAATILVGLKAGAELGDDRALAFVRAITDAPDRALVSVGRLTEGVDGAMQSLQEAIDLAHSARLTGIGPQIRRSEQRPLMRLVTSLRDDHRLLEHGERMLAPLIDYDLTRQGDLLDVLEAMLQHPSNRTAAATASHLSRSVFYQRITLIEELLGVNLDDGEIQTALHIALLVRRRARR